MNWNEYTYEPGAQHFFFFRITWHVNCIGIGTYVSLWKPCLILATAVPIDVLTHKVIASIMIAALVQATFMAIVSILLSRRVSNQNDLLLHLYLFPLCHSTHVITCYYLRRTVGWDKWPPNTNWAIHGTNKNVSIGCSCTISLAILQCVTGGGRLSLNHRSPPCFS